MKLKNYFDKESLIVIKMESLFLSFIEDNFFSYMFNKYGFIVGVKSFFLYIIDFKKFQINIIKEINSGDFLNYLYLNHHLLDYLKQQKRNHKLVILSHYSQDIVDIFVSYFNFSKGFGNCKSTIINQCKFLKKQMVFDNIHNSIFVTDDIDMDFSIKYKKIISSGSLMKTFINCLFHKNVYIIKSSNSYNGWLYQRLIDIQNKKISPLWYGFLLIAIPLVEILIISRLFFYNIFIMMFLLFILSITIFPEIFLFKYSFFLLMETNNIFNMYNIVISFNIDESNKTLVSHGVMKSFGSLSLGLFLFCFVNFLYFNNKFSLVFQIFYIGFFLKYSKDLLKIKNYKILLCFFNIFAGYFFI
jgi:hypothetical protein